MEASAEGAVRLLIFPNMRLVYSFVDVLVVWKLPAGSLAADLKLEDTLC